MSGSVKGASRGSVFGRAHLLLSAAVAATAFSGGEALAQAGAEEGLEEIIVTARKRDESAQDIPVAVSALSGEELINRNIRSIEQISAAMPQLVVVRASSGSGSNFSIRGIGSNFTSIGIEQSVSVNVDGMYYGQGRIMSEGFYDMERVELLKGPQALYFGKNATAGVLSLVTANPGSEFEALARAGYEFTTHERSVEGTISGPLTDWIGARLAVRYASMEEGYINNQTPAGLVFRVTDTGAGNAVTDYVLPAPDRYGPLEETFSARGTLRFTPSDEFEAILKASMSEREATSAGFLNELFLCPVTGTSQLNPGNECVGNWNSYWTDLPGALVGANRLLGQEGGRMYDHYSSDTLVADLSYSPGPVSFSWVTGYERFNTEYTVKSDATSNTNRGTYAGTDSTYEAYSTELRAQSEFEAPLNFMAGLYYQASSLDFLQDILFPGSAAGGHLINSAELNPELRPLTVRKYGETDGTTFALFGQLQWDISEELQATLGARFTHETKDSVFSLPYVHPAFRAVFIMENPANANSLIDHHQQFDNFSPEATLTWQPTEDITVYGAYRSGYKSGGFSISGLNSAQTRISDLAFDPETVEGWEAGVRTEFLNRRLRFNVTAFSYTYDDLQVDFFNSAITTFVTFNAGAARTEGVELEAEWLPSFIEGFSLRGTLNYDDAQYTDFPGAPCYAGQRPAQGCLAATAAIPYIHQNLTGVATQLAPEWTGSLGINYDRAIGGGLEAGVSVNARYSGDYSVTPFGNPLATQDAYTMLDASLRLSAESDRWELAVIGKNLTDEYVLNGAVDSPSTGAGTGTAAGVLADQYGLPAPPQTVAVQLSLRY